MKLEDINPDEVDELSSIKIDRRKTSNERILDFLTQVKNPYVFKVNGKLVRTGINVVLLGKPNAGKSSILNNLLEENRAIVTNIPGTTRDIIEGKINLEGITLNFIDTAGLRETVDEVEKIGVKKSLDKAQEADLIIYVIDNSERFNFDDLKLLENYDCKKIVFINKNDLQSSNDYSDLDSEMVVYGNTMSEEGLVNLKNKIIEMFKINELESSDFSFISNARQISLIKKVSECINNALNSVENLVPIDMYTIDIKEAYDLLGKIIGKTYDEDLLDELFSRFCLGK